MLLKIDAYSCASDLATFIIENQFDGADLEFKDDFSFEYGDNSGEDWLITFTMRLKELLSD